MRILVISNMYPATKDPSFGVFVKNFYSYLEDKNGNNNTHLIAIKGKPKTRIGKFCKYAFFYLKASLSLFAKKYDLVYVHFITYSIIPIRLVTLFKEIPLAFNIHGSDWITQTPIAETLKRIALPIVGKAKLVVVPSSIFKELILKDLPQVDPQRIIVSCSGGIDTDRFKPKEKKIQDTDTRVLGYVSRIIEKKGWRLFVEAVKVLKEKGLRVKGIMAGGGEQEQELISLLTSYGLNEVIEYKGAVAQEALPDLYNQMDLFIFPTLFYESLGLVGLEAMACGIPIIGSNHGGVKEYVKQGVNGFLFVPGNVIDLCDKIESYISMEDDRKRTIKENAIQTAKSFDKLVVMDELVGEIYKCVR